MSSTNMRQATTTEAPQPRIGRRVKAWLANRKSVEVILTLGLTLGLAIAGGGFTLLRHEVNDVERQVEELRSDMREDRVRLEDKIEREAAKTRQEMAQLREEMRLEMAQLREEMRQEMAQLREEIITLMQAYHGQPPGTENAGQSGEPLAPAGNPGDAAF